MTRAAHLELAKDLYADTFLLLFRKFVARRSLPRLMNSVNGTYFKLTASPLPKIFLEDHDIE